MVADVIARGHVASGAAQTCHTYPAGTRRNRVLDARSALAESLTRAKLARCRGRVDGARVAAQQQFALLGLLLSMLKVTAVREARGGLPCWHRRRSR